MGANEADHASGFYPLLDHPTSGTLHYTGMPFTLDGRRVPTKRPPLLGEHTEAVLYDVLGLEAAEVGALWPRALPGTNALRGWVLAPKGG